MIDRDLEAEIRRLFFAEHWKKGTIATQHGVHPDVVDRAIGPLGPEPASRPPRPSVLDPYKPFIEETLDRYPKLVATRINDMLVERGYSGSQRTVTRYLRDVRPAPKSEVFLRTERLPGEQSQVDWGHVGKIRVPGGERALWVFVLVLAFSRAIFAELVFELSVHSLRRSLLNAALFFGGVTRQWLFDNPKTVVLERQGDLIRFHPGLLDITAALHVQPRLCGVRKPHQKGGVERQVRFLKDRFFAARLIHSIEHGNAELRRFLLEIAMERPHPVHPERTVAEVLEDERAHLLALPGRLPSVELVTPVSVDKTATVRFDTNRYSVPPLHARSTLTLVASDTEVRMLDDDQVVAAHPRCFGRRQLIENPDHRREVLATKPGARDGKGRERLLAASPRMGELLEGWLRDGRNMGSMTARTLKLLDLYGETVLGQALDELLERGSRDLGALAILCDQKLRPRRTALPLVLGDHVNDRDVIPHDLGGYDD
jgi:transposase